MIGKARPFIGLDEIIIRLARTGDHQVDAGDRNLDRLGRPDSRLDQDVMGLSGHIVDCAAGMEIGRPPDRERLAVGQDVVEPVTGGGQAAPGLIVDHDPGFAAGRRQASSRLDLDQILDRALAVAEDFRRAPDRDGQQRDNRSR